MLRAGADPPPKRLTVALLGPLRVVYEGQPVPLTTPRLRTVIAVLALSAGAAVPAHRVARAVWRENLPGNARRSVQTYVSRLRVMFGRELIDTTAAGYTLRAARDDIDALRFMQLVDAAVVADTDERSLLQEALALWRGEPFVDVASAWLRESQASFLVDRYLRAAERRADIDIAAGRYDTALNDLGPLVEEQPLRESLWVRLLTVLAASGRRAEALKRYETIRRRIAEELGVGPAPELQRLHAELIAEGQATIDVRYSHSRRPRPRIVGGERVATRRR